jgi:lysozyme
MSISDNGLSLIKRFEGLRLTAYDDGVGVQTIGYGHTRGVKAGDTCTEAQADEWLREDVAEAVEAVERLVAVPLAQPQRDALISFIFNVGAGAFEDSTLLRKLNAGDLRGAADQLPRWNKGGGRVLTGLVDRRAAERDLFMSTMSTEAPQGVPVAKNLIEAILGSALPTLIQAAPELIRAVGDSAQSEKNARVMEVVADVVTQTTGAPNLQAGIESISADPAVAANFRAGVQERFFEISEAGGGGIDGARKADTAFASSGRKPLDSPALWISLLMMAMPFMLLVDLFYVHPGSYDMPLRTQIVTGVLGVIALVGAFWLGSSFGSQKKDERK